MLFRRGESAAADVVEVFSDEEEGTEALRSVPRGPKDKARVVAANAFVVPFCRVVMIRPAAVDQFFARIDRIAIFSDLGVVAIY